MFNFLIKKLIREINLILERLIDQINGERGRVEVIEKLQLRDRFVNKLKSRVSPRRGQLYIRRVRNMLIEIKLTVTRRVIYKKY